jgi:transposase
VKYSRLAACFTIYSLSHRLPIIIKSKIMEKVISFEQVNEAAAGIDIGSEKIFVSPDGIVVDNFGTYTSEYHRCISYLQERSIKRVAMEATGIYWISLYSMLEGAGIRVSLVNPKETKQKKGKKTDVRDCRWIQKLFSAGLLKESFIPEGKMLEIRYLVRERLDIIEMGSTYVNKMQRCLELMNIKLTEVISQIHGASGMRMLKAIIKGERDPQALLLLCDERIQKQKGTEVLKALEGNYNDTWLFMLEQNIRLWEQHQQQIKEIDKRTGTLLEELTAGKSIDKSVIGKAKPVRHHKPQISNLHETLVKFFGVNVTSISGLNSYTLLRLIGETGADMSRFETKKHFISWCGLSAGHHQSGKRSKWIKQAPCNKAGQIFKEVAQSLENSKYIAIGSFIRRLKVRRGASVAYKAGARKVAEAYYNILTKGVAYVEQGIKQYEEQLKQRELGLLKKLAKKHQVQIVEKPQAA